MTLPLGSTASYVNWGIRSTPASCRLGSFRALLWRRSRMPLGLAALRDVRNTTFLDKKWPNGLQPTTAWPNCFRQKKDGYGFGSPSRRGGVYSAGARNLDPSPPST